jgi:hypothetical protein
MECLLSCLGLLNVLILLVQFGVWLRAAKRKPLVERSHPNPVSAANRHDGC